MRESSPTVLVNIFGGPGVGKSTLAAQVYSSLSAQKEKSVELVTEYAKEWAWRDIVPKNTGDQIFIAANQIYREAALYGKVDIIVTDSPWLLSPVYEQLYMNTNITACMLVKYYSHLLSERNVVIKNFILKRRVDYTDVRRFETTEMAKRIDDSICLFLDSFAIPYTELLLTPQLAHDKLIGELWTPLQKSN